MENKNKNQKKGSIIPALVVFTAIALFNAMENPRELAVLVPVFVIAVIIAVIVFAAKKKGGSPAAKRPGSVSAAAKCEAAKPAIRRRDEEQAEEAIGCHHATGKEKYIQQLDSYLKAGLIDRAEYKVLKERYSKLDIPDDYH